MTSNSWVRSVIVLAAPGVFLLAASASPGGGSGVERGRTSSIVFEGQQTFTAEDLRKALRMNLNWLEVAAPEIPVDECLKRLEPMLLSGYLHAGFPDARIHATFNQQAGQIRVKISEGPRYACGPITVSGLKTIDRTELVRLISGHIQKPASGPNSTELRDGLNTFVSRSTQPNPPGVRIIATNSPATPGKPLGIWDSESPAPFDDSALLSLRWAITNVFASLGHFFPDFRAEVVPQPATGKAALVVTVREEGPACAVGAVEVTGATRNSSAQIQRYAGLTSGMRLNQQLLDEKRRLLEECGRFGDVDLEPARPQPDGRVTLLIRVRESRTAPPLSQDFSAEEQGLSKVRQWLTSWASGSEDLVVKAQSERSPGQVDHHLELVISPAGGILATFKAGDGEHELNYTLLASTNQFGLFLPTQSRKLVQPRFKGNLVVMMRLKLNPEEEQPTNFSIGAGFASEDTSVPFRMDLDFAPAAFVHMAHDRDRRFHFEGHTLVVSNKTSRARVDTDSGRLLQLEGAFAWRDQEYPRAKYRCEFEKGAFLKASAQVQAAAAGHTNWFDPAKPLASSLSFLGGLMLQNPYVLRVVTMQPNQAEEVGRVLGKLLAKDVLAPFEQLWPADMTTSTQVFTATWTTGGGSLPFAMLGGWLADSSERLLPPNCWAGQLFRAQVFGLCGKLGASRAGIQALRQSEELGPLACVCAASSLFKTRVAPPETVRAFALEGLVRMSEQNFRQDYRSVIQEQSALRGVLDNLFRAMLALNPAEFKALTSLLPPSEAELLTAAIDALRKAGEKDLPTVLQGPLEQYWTQALRARCSAQLRQILAGTPP